MSWTMSAGSSIVSWIRDGAIVAVLARDIGEAEEVYRCSLLMEFRWSWQTLWSKVEGAAGIWARLCQES